MVNKIFFEGRFTKIVFENDKLIKFVVENTNGKKVKKAKITCFDKDLIRVVKLHLGDHVKITGEFYENNYKDKNDNWVNDYTINMTKFEVINDNTNFEPINDDEMPF